MASNATLSVDDQLIIYLGEVPSMPASIVALCCYTAVTIALLLMTIKTRGWFMITAVITGALEALGFVARVLLIKTGASNALVMMQCLLIISPVLLAIIEYVCVGKLIARSEAGRNTRWLRWQVYAFTTSDFISLVVQGAGGAMLAQGNIDPQTAETGRVLILAGLALQLAFFGSFLFVTICIHIVPRFGYKGNAEFSRVFLCLYITIVLLYIRNVFRVVEFTQGWRGYLATHEIYFYIFDFIPILLTFVFFTMWHYGLWLTPSTDVTPSPPESGAASSADLMEQGKQGQQGKQGKQVEDVEPSVRSNTSAPSATGTEATAAAQGGVQMVYVSPRQS